MKRRVFVASAGGAVAFAAVGSSRAQDLTIATSTAVPTPTPTSVPGTPEGWVPGPFDLLALGGWSVSWPENWKGYWRLTEAPDTIDTVRLQPGISSNASATFDYDTFDGWETVQNVDPSYWSDMREYRDLYLNYEGEANETTYVPLPGVDSSQLVGGNEHRGWGLYEAAQRTFGGVLYLDFRLFADGSMLRVVGNFKDIAIFKKYQEPFQGIIDSIKIPK